MSNMSNTFEQGADQLPSATEDVKDPLAEHDSPDSRSSDCSIKEFKAEDEVEVKFEYEDLPATDVLGAVKNEDYAAHFTMPESLSDEKLSPPVQASGSSEPSDGETCSVVKENLAPQDGSVVCSVTKKDLASQDSSDKCSLKKKDPPPQDSLDTEPLTKEGQASRDGPYPSVDKFFERALAQGHNTLYQQFPHTEEKPLYCDICSYEASNRVSLKKHVASYHSDDKPFACNLCDYRAGRKAYLQKHIMSEHEKPFACDKCPYKASQQNYLERHMLTHLKEPPAVDIKLFSCDFCDYSTSKKVCLHKHLLNHTSKKSFSCDRCSYKTTTRGLLQKHMMTHDRKRPHDKPHSKISHEGSQR